MEIKKIPIVDFAACRVDIDAVSETDKKSIGDAVYKALAVAGFVYLKNTGVTQEQIDKLKSKTREFFDLDIKTKENYVTDKNFLGYIGNGQERLNPKRPADLKEAYDVNGPGMLSNDVTWPDDIVPDFSTTFKEFAEICKKLAMRLLEVVAVGMDMKDRDLFLRSHSKMNGKNNFTSLRSLLYRPIPESMQIQPNQVRLGEHSDFGSLTLVFQDQVGGLQVKTPNGAYVDATPIPGTVLVNVGECLQFWTQDRLKSTEHRILLPKDETIKRSERTSIVYFAKANNETVLKEIEYGSAHRLYQKPKAETFKSIASGQYIEMRIKETLLLA